MQDVYQYHGDSENEDFCPSVPVALESGTTKLVVAEASTLLYVRNRWHGVV